MSVVLRLSAAATLVGLLGGCADPTVSARRRGAALLADGFTTGPVAAAPSDTPSMPDFSRRPGAAGSAFLTADPHACDCAYRGSLPAYTRYEVQATEQRQAADATAGTELSRLAEQQWQALWPGLGW